MIIQNKDDRSNEKLSVKIVFLITLLGCLIPLSWDSNQDFLHSVIHVPFTSSLPETSLILGRCCPFQANSYDADSTVLPQVLFPLLYSVLVWLLPCCLFVMGVKKVKSLCQ